MAEAGAQVGGERELEGSAQLGREERGHALGVRDEAVRGTLAAEELEHDHGQGVDVGRGRRDCRARLELGGEVAAIERCRGAAEVEQHGVAVGAEADSLRAEVAVNDAASMGGCQRREDLAEERDDRPEG